MNWNWKPVARLCAICGLSLTVLCSHHGPHVHSTYGPSFIQVDTIPMATSSEGIGGRIPSTVTISWGTMTVKSTST